jgi:hypothetical protein
MARRSALPGSASSGGCRYTNETTQKVAGDVQHRPATRMKKICIDTRALRQTATTQTIYTRFRQITKPHRAAHEMEGR